MPSVKLEAVSLCVCGWNGRDLLKRSSGLISSSTMSSSCLVMQASSCAFSGPRDSDPVFGSQGRLEVCM